MQSNNEMTNNQLIIATAGSGKTTLLVDKALKLTNANILITTYTKNNEAEIRNRFFEKNKGYIPKHITVQTWFSFLLKHGVRPYQGHLYEPDIKGMVLVNGRSGLKYKTKQGVPVYYKETDIEKHYLNDEKKMYSDKIAKFACECDKKSINSVVKRLAQIYTHIFIDEVQDLAGYDLNFLKLLFQSKIGTLLVGDPRQAIYSTNNASKNKKFKKSAIVSFFEDSSIKIEKDEQSLKTNHRCISTICELSNNLFPNLQKTTSGNNTITEHDGIFLVRDEDVAKYLKKYTPIQLRYNKDTPTSKDYKTINFGESKGLSFDRVLIYPTTPIKKWLRNRNTKLEPISRSKLYVAITRARQSVAFFFDYKDEENIEGMEKYKIEK